MRTMAILAMAWFVGLALAGEDVNTGLFASPESGTVAGQQLIVEAMAWIPVGDWSTSQQLSEINFVLSYDPTALRFDGWYVAGPYWYSYDPPLGPGLIECGVKWAWDMDFIPTARAVPPYPAALWCGGARFTALRAGASTVAIESCAVWDFGGYRVHDLFHESFDCVVTVGVLRGDMDGNGAVDGQDINPFIERLLGDQVPVLGDDPADMNGDGAVNGQDIDLFVAALLP